MTANAERSTPHSHFDERVEELAVLVEGEAVRHPRDVVADHPVRAFALDPLVVVRRKLERLAHERLEQVAHDAPRLVAHAHDAVVAIHVPEEELLQLADAGGHVVGVADEAASRPSHVLYRADPRGLELAPRGLEKVADAAVDDPPDHLVAHDALVDALGPQLIVRPPA